MSIRNNYKHTLAASYIGFITLAVINNFAPLLFLTFQSTYKIPLGQITLLVTVNFTIQLLVDVLSAKFIDKIGYKVSIVTAHFAAGAGILGLGIFPELFPDPFTGLLLAISIYAFGGGLIDVLASPIVEACPTENKPAVMSLLHSFYCWGHVGVVLLSTAFFALVGIDNWRILACIWALIPAFNLLYFSQVPLYPIVGENEGLTIRNLLGQKLFWLLMLLMVSAGAAEQAMSQWSSAFAEAGLRVDKTIGDLAGPCGFALLMGLARLLHGKYSDHIPLKQMMMGSAGLCVACYLLAGLSGNPVLGLVGCALCGFSVGIFWPGTLSIAARTLPTGGTAMFAFLALAGDLGCVSPPKSTDIELMPCIGRNSGHQTRLSSGRKPQTSPLAIRLSTTSDRGHLRLVA